MIQCRLPAVEMSGRKRASSGMQMSLVQKQDMYCKVPEWAREFLPDIDKPWKQKGPYGCRRLEPSGWNCHLCGCEGSSSHVFGMPHLTKCYWDKYPGGHEALEDSSDDAQEPGPILAIEDRSPGASPSAAATASSVACAPPTTPSSAPPPRPRASFPLMTNKEQPHEGQCAECEISCLVLKVGKCKPYCADCWAAFVSPSSASVRASQQSVPTVNTVSGEGMSPSPACAEADREAEQEAEAWAEARRWRPIDAGGTFVVEDPGGVPGMLRSIDEGGGQPDPRNHERSRSRSRRRVPRQPTVPPPLSMRGGPGLRSPSPPPRPPPRRGPGGGPGLRSPSPPPRPSSRRGPVGGPGLRSPSPPPRPLVPPLPPLPRRQPQPRQATAASAASRTAWTESQHERMRPRRPNTR